VGDSGPRTLDILLADSTTYDVASLVSFFLVSHNSILASYSTSCLYVGLLLLFLAILSLVLSPLVQNAVAYGVMLSLGEDPDSPTQLLL